MAAEICAEPEEEGGYFQLIPFGPIDFSAQVEMGSFIELLVQPIAAIEGHRWTAAGPAVQRKVDPPIQTVQAITLHGFPLSQAIEVPEAVDVLLSSEYAVLDIVEAHELACNEHVTLGKKGIAITGLKGVCLEFDLDEGVLGVVPKGEALCVIVQACGELFGGEGA